MKNLLLPMFAAPMPKEPLDLKARDWVAEEKIDGHRIMVEVIKGKPTAWSRNGIIRDLPDHIRVELAKLPDLVGDGELYVPGHRSYGVTEELNSPHLVYTMFDLLQIDDIDLMPSTFRIRRFSLEGVVPRTGPVHVGWSVPLEDQEQLNELLASVWARDGEGLILKRKDSIYIPSKRPKNTWIKLKQCQPATLTVVGFVPTKGLIMNRGMYATVVLKDDEGNYTTVKTRNDLECHRFEMAAPEGTLVWGEVVVVIEGKKKKIKYHYGVDQNDEFTLGFPGVKLHPSIGRRLCIEFQERTPDKSYRHPRWDRWENE